MKKIKVLGPGCPKCEELLKQTKQAADEIGLEYTIEKITDIQEITSYQVMTTPALIVDDIIKFSGSVPKLEELKKMLN